MIVFISIIAVAIAAVDPDVHRDFIEIVTSKGYPCEHHSVVTSDGYQLGLFRIPGKSRASPPVLLFHGLLDSSFTWIVNMKDESLPYILADNGYDVWFGNARGNRYSNSSINFPPSDSRFWNFSFDDFAAVDLPTTIDYVLQTTGNSNLYYVGHSQGTTQMFAALSEDTNGNLTSKLRLFIGLGPVTTPAHQTNVFLSVLSSVTSQLDYAFKLLGINSFLPPFTGIFSGIADLLCFEDPAVCEGVIELICGQHQGAFNLSRMEVMVAHEPGGTSVRNMVHWGQLINSGKFQKFDYGKDGNMAHYGIPTPPLYNIGNINSKLPIALIYGDKDELADPVDVMNIIKTLPTPPVFVKEIPAYAHLDFCWATDANVQVYQDVLNLIKKY